MKTLEEKRKARAKEYYLRKKQQLVSWLVRGRQGYMLVITLLCL